jgi:hypothetical protein
VGQEEVVISARPPPGFLQWNDPEIDAMLECSATTPHLAEQKAPLTLAP